MIHRGAFSGRVTGSVTSVTSQERRLSFNSPELIQGGTHATPRVKTARISWKSWHWRDRTRFDRQASATKQRPLPWSLPILMRKTVFFFVSFHRKAMQAWVLFLVSIERGTPMPDLSLPSLAV